MAIEWQENSVHGGPFTLRNEPAEQAAFEGRQAGTNPINCNQ